jgi:long-chain acyl-CoA synthetase
VYPLKIGPVTVWEVFAATAERCADRSAVVLQRASGSETWAYRRLHAQALSCAAWLAARGVRAGDRCAILADNDGSWCAAYLGILRLQAVAVPLDTNYTPAQVATIVRDASPRVLLVNTRLQDIAREATAGSADIIVSDIAFSATSGAVDVLPPAGGAADDPAVILYTSGTTADPKGVVLTHGNLIAERDAAFHIVEVDERDSVLGVLPLFHALAQLANLLLPFAVGARVVFLETVNSTELLRALAEQRITVFACVPQFFYLIHQRVMREAAGGGVTRRTIFGWLLAISFRLRRAGLNVGPLIFGRVHAVLGSQMRLFITGGSKFDPKIGRDFYALGFTVLQAYGLTETSGAATLTRPDEAHLDTVGRALPGQSLKILEPEEAGLDGEIAVRGPIVMRGYFNRAEATDAVMREEWLLTGDLGRLDASGRLAITGRKKEVIVLASGKNIYPEEVEAHYRRSPFIEEICVLGLASEAEPTTERLFAVVVPDRSLLRERRIVNAGDLLRFEMEGQSVHLPAHKRVLGYDVWFEPLPRTTTGKLKRHEIERTLRQRRAQRAQTTVARGDAALEWPQDAHASAAAAIIAKRGRGATVVPSSNLELDLGLDSMERVELITELEQRFGVSVRDDAAHTVFTVEQLIEAVRPGADAASGQTTDDAWTVMLRDLPLPTDPVLSGLLERRPIAAAVLFLLARVLRLILPRVEVSGVERLPPLGPYLICPNHQCYLDPFIICGTLPYRAFRELFFVGAAEYFETPLTRWVARVGNCVPVDPDANLVPAMKAGAFGLTHGKILMLFPEGERSIDGTVKRFKKGAPILSRHLGVPIVPVAIRGAFEVWPRNFPLAWKTLLPWSGHRIHVAIGTPLEPDVSLPHADAAARLQTRVEEMWSTLP